MTDLTVITPIAPHHAALFRDCYASVLAQTVAVKHLFAVDETRRGPGAVRNELLRSVDTPFVTFLDSDDWLDPHFAELTLQQAQASGHYIYTDWFQEGRTVESPDCPWINHTFHLVTAVVPTEWVRAVGGFDETLRGMEDTDFYVKLVTSGYCGARLKLPLVHYRAEGGRAKALHETGEIDALQAEMSRRYGDKKVSCCGDPIETPNLPIGEKQPGDVLVQATWGGNHPEFGRATGRRYPRMSFPHTTWVDPRDIALSPNLWRVVVEPESEQPDKGLPDAVHGLDGIQSALQSFGVVKSAPPPVVPLPEPPRMPNINKVKRLAGVLRLPIFVSPRTEYPSYADFWKLVDLSGFERLYQDEIDLNDPEQTYIFSGPDGIPNCTRTQARTIFWQLEYTGEYTNQPNCYTAGEYWSSNPGDVSASKSIRYVLLGSHKWLNPDNALPKPAQREPLYDITMLAYMVDRRQNIKDRLSGKFTFAPDYPGHDGAARHEVLSRSRLMLAVHQSDTPALAPIRLALAAAYRLPVICEDVAERGLYADAVLWAGYDKLPEIADLWLRGKLEADYLYDGLYHLLCEQHPFYDCVMQGLRGEGFFVFRGLDWALRQNLDQHQVVQGSTQQTTPNPVEQYYNKPPITGMDYLLADKVAEQPKRKPGKSRKSRAAK